VLGQQGPGRGEKCFAGGGRVTAAGTRLPDLRLADEDGIGWKAGLSTRGPLRLPVLWG
jgi:hypothetical protein